MQYEKQLQSGRYILLSDGRLSSAVIGSSVTGRRCGLSQTMLWWLFLSMMSDEGSSSFLMGEGGGVAGFTLGLNRSDM